MKPTMEILEQINTNSSKNKNEIFTRLYRYLLRPDIYYIAYKNLYANAGAGTKGIDNDTADGFSESYVMRIIKKLKDETYQPKPTRRIYIEKKNSDKLRPLGIPSFTDKLVQEALRMILEAVYEPIFLDSSHGFRPNRSCHTALKNIKKGFNGARWFVEGDIKGCFDNIDHSVLVNIVNSKIKDARLIKLIYKFLKAGYIEEWKYHNTYSGTPQGGIISPLFANIYLHELDKHVDKLKKDFDKAPQQVFTSEYNSLVWKRKTVSEKINVSSEDEKPALVQEYKKLSKQLRKTPSKSQTDKKIKYIRYADDFILAINGSREDCMIIKKSLSDFIKNELKMELSDEKTLITHSNNYARFLSYDIRVRRDGKVKRDKNGVKKRSLNNTTELNIPLKEKVEKFLFSHNAIRIKKDEVIPCERVELFRLTNLEILNTYNSELRGLCNYYGLASNFGQLTYFSYLMEYSCLKTLAGKNKTKIAKIKKKYRDGKGKWCIPYETQKGRKFMYFADYQKSKDTAFADDIIKNVALYHSHSTTTFENRLKAGKCELCGTTESEKYEVHHINKVKNLKGKELWEQVMIAKRRKTIVVCENCHKLIHGKKV